jgi:hypothetical protein
MPIDAVQTGEVFTVRTYKQHAGFGWANTYEVQATTEPVNSVTAIESMASAFVALEQLIHLTPVTIDRVVVSTYVPDGQPYNPSSFTTIPVSLPGQRAPSGDFLPLELCLFVRRNGAVGRDGRLLYRGCLLEVDMGTDAFRGRVQPSVRNSFQTTFNTWFTTTFPQAQWNIVLARGAPNPTNVRQVISFQVSEKIAVKKLKNRYFDRP